MWKRGLNWAAVTLVAVFGLLWLGVVVFAATATSGWLRTIQALFSLFLIGWAIRKSVHLIRTAT
ncbi:hypothetical protein DQ384_21150 [Sphaerisporangium album]|uniref:Uncharacterized protein n=1 Tax=Sphaerisporangium album TaxID=509200 RepID=A0A367FGT8_9ACTN|nr:hypothetical protein [Sphaerisporangium album]RCG29531.1 hypothetical protein DQ384_21150 [Sphaerisporangium album]